MMLNPFLFDQSLYVPEVVCLTFFLINKISYKQVHHAVVDIFSSQKRSTAECLLIIIFPVKKEHENKHVEVGQEIIYECLGNFLVITRQVVYK